MDFWFVALVGACTLFVGTHFLLSHPWRRPLIRAMGDHAFTAIYSIIALVTFTGVIVAFDHAPRAPALWDGTALVPWVLASILTIVALGLLLPSFIKNPSLPLTSTAGLATRRPTGVFLITRHPMMMAIALWAVAHILVAPTPRTIVLALAMAFLALVGAKMQDEKKLRDEKKQALNKHEWSGWMKRTRFWPDVRKLGVLGIVWILAVIVWLGVTALHMGLADTPAGLWR